MLRWFIRCYSVGYDHGARINAKFKYSSNSGVGLINFLCGRM